MALKTYVTLFNERLEQIRDCLRLQIISVVWACVRQEGSGSFYFLFCDHTSECSITFEAFVVTYGKL